MRKNKTIKEFKNFKMTPEVFKLRKKVINVLYELKHIGGTKQQIVGHL